MLATTKNSRYYQSVSVIVPANSTAPGSFYFPDLPNLRNKKIEKISVYNYATVPHTPDNILVTSVGQNIDSYLVLYVNEREYIKMPLSHLQNITTSSTGSRTFLTVDGYAPLNNLDVIWSKSYVKWVNSGTTSPGTPSAYFFGIWYK